MAANIPLKVLSYNIHKGFSLGKKFVLDRIKEAIRTEQADLVFLQEVIGENETHAKKIDGWPGSSQFEYLADQVWPHFAYGKNAVYDSGHHGNAILSKYPIVAWENIDVSFHRLESRGLLHAEIEIPGVRSHVHCICVHLGLSERARGSQVKWLIDRVLGDTEPEDPLIIAGDFNDWPASASKKLTTGIGVYEVFKHHHGRHARTFPARFPVLMLDRIYVRGLDTVDARCLQGEPWAKLSDHSALLAELTIKK